VGFIVVGAMAVVVMVVVVVHPLSWKGDMTPIGGSPRAQ
jgi:hypothetical protein